MESIAVCTFAFVVFLANAVTYTVKAVRGDGFGAVHVLVWAFMAGWWACTLFQMVARYE